MKVLHIIDGLGTGGKERRLLAFLKYAHTYPEVQNRLLLLSDTVHYDAAGELGIPIDYITRKRRKDFSVFGKIVDVCRRFRPDILHSWESMCSVYTAPVAGALGIKFINAMITNASPVRIASRKWLRSKLTFPFSDVILANSRAGLEAYGAPLHKSAYVHNGFDFERTRMIESDADVRRRHGIHTPHVVGMVAAVDDRKEYGVFVQVAKQVLKARNDVTFMAIGDGPLLNHYRKMSAEIEPGRLIFVGRRMNVEAYINIFTIGVLLTRGEGISNAIMEYMAFAKPVIATTGGGTPEIVADGQTGFLVNPQDTASVRRKLRFLLDNSTIAIAMGQAGKARIHRDFNIEKMSAEIVALYRTCLTVTKRRSGRYTGRAPSGSGTVPFAPHDKPTVD
ncbi:MAG: hypothetical protein VR64_14405 [Desulfatitalea sp. BRH_c12]|nr:MAG: hypothetical protein VR64_14405 [Desulfatitalea sp. BRH_c12]